MLFASEDLIDPNPIASRRAIAVPQSSSLFLLLSLLFLLILHLPKFLVIQEEPPLDLSPSFGHQQASPLHYITAQGPSKPLPHPWWS